MATQVHGHEVMQMMVASDAVYTKETLRTAIVEKFGEEARYFTCSADGMTAAELIEFLDARGKFQAVPGGFRTDAGRICQH